MKLRKLLLKTMPVIVLSTGLVSSITSCGNTNKLPKVSSHEVRKVLLNTLASSSSKYYYVASEYGPIEMHHFNSSSIGYINVDEYVDYTMKFSEIYTEEDVTDYKSETKNYKTTITNVDNGSTCVIDYEKQTLTFSDYDLFTTVENEFKNNPMAHGAGGGDKYFIKDSKTGNIYQDSKYVSGGEYVIDLSKYNIKAYYDDGKGYLPYDLFRNILNNNSLYHLFYNGVGLYEICTSNSVNGVDLYKQLREETTILDKEYMEYTYNLLALTLDNKFGLYDRVSRAPATKGQIKKYFANGAYEALAPYKEDLTSLDPDIANDAMFRVFRDLCDDGGHAGYNGIDILSTKPHTRARGPEATQTFDVMDMVANARATYSSATQPVDPYDYWVKRFGKYNVPEVTDNCITLYGRDEAKPILYVTFDSFNHVQYATTEKEIEEGKVRYEDVKCDYLEAEKDDNYMLDTVRMTMGANKYITDYNDKHTGDQQIKNIVVDLSNNGGGTVYTEHFIASWLCGGFSDGVIEKGWNPHTKAYGEYKIQADVNGNGVWDKGDYLDPSINVFLITSDTSFSCGNMLPCNLVDNRSSNTYCIGSPSGGGACFVDSNMHIGLGNVFRSSSNFHMLRKASTKDNPITVDSGHLAEPEEGSQGDFWYYIASTTKDAPKFTDRATINDKIRNI